MSSDNRLIDETLLQEAIDRPYGGKPSVVMDSQILTALMACPRMTDFRFNHNLVSLNGKSNSLECGSIVHAFLEYYYKAIIQGVSKEQAAGFGFAAAETYIKGCPTCTDFVSTPENPKPSCGHQVNYFMGVRNTPANNEGNIIGWKYVLDVCQQYLDYYRNDSWVPLKVETVEGLKLYEDAEVRVIWKAKIDLIADTNQGIYSVDHKTMKQRRKTNSMNNQFMGQCHVMGTRTVYLNKVGFQSTLKPEEKFTRDGVSYSAPRLLEWQSETVPFYAKLLLMYAEAGHFPPNFTSCEGKYGDCPFYAEVCSSDPGMREENIKKNFYVGPAWNPVNEND